MPRAPRLLRAVLAAAVLLLAGLAAAGCGSSTEVREEPVVVQGSDAPPNMSAAPPRPANGSGVDIAVVTHGQASSPFWAIVRNGVEAAARQLDVVVDYRAPDVYSLARMETLIEDAIARKPDGLVVSVPEPELAPAIRRAARSGIPVVSINSGGNIYRTLGVLAHVGQPEDRAGREAGQRLARAGVRRALCVNQQVGNVGLDARCRGLAQAMRRAGGRSRVLAVDDQDPGTPRRISDAIDAGRIDGVLALNSTTGLLALDAAGRDVPVATFDLGPDVLEAVKAGRLRFAVDQQAYLQGYLPIVMLAQRARYGLFPSQGDLVATGPNFVTRATAGKAIALAERSIR
jgi:simple sugar transport system substrate-binding protein